MVGQSVRCRIFVGRRTELAALEAARRALAKSSGSFMLVAGEAGIGKTRLLTEFLALAGSRRARNLVNTECAQHTVQPFGPIRSILRALVPTIRLSDLSTPILLALAQVIPEELPRDVVARNADVVLEKEPLFSALLGFLRLVCTKRATLVTIEDIHWCDRSTLEFLTYLVHRIDGMRLLVVATCRSDELAANEPLLASLSPLFREPHFNRVVLEPLLPREIRALVDGALEGRHLLPEPVARDIERRSEGNPFFAEELVKDFIEGKDAGRESRQLPGSIRASIAQRLTSFSPQEREILGYAAVLGQRFDPALLAVIMERDSASVVPALRHARDLNLVVDVARGRLTCRFRHALIRQAIYDDFPLFEARKLHAHILVTLEAEDEAELHIEELAYHAWEAGDTAKTLRYNERAGDAAFSLRALPEALVCFERALEAASDLGDRARLYERIAAIERLHGHYQRAREALDAAIAIRLDRGEFDAATVQVANVVGQRYNLGDQDALPYAERFLEEHQQAISPPARDHLLVVCARIASAFQDFRAAERFLNAVSNPETLHPSIRQHYLIVQLLRHGYAGNVKEWKRNAEQVDQLLPYLPPELVVGVENALAVTGIHIGANEYVERALDRAERVEREWGFRGQRLYGVGARAAYLYQRGMLAHARACVEQVAAHQDVLTARRIGAAVAAHLGVAFGDETLWRSFDAEVLREARERLDDPDCVFILGAHAGLSAANGALSEAQADLRAAITTLSYAAPEAMYVLLNAARFLPVDEVSRVSELAEMAERSGGEAVCATRALVQATIAARLGKPAEAELFGVTAAALYNALGWPILEANALELAGKREMARAIYDRCGALADFQRLSDPAPAPKVAAIARLSSRESEVAALVARGLRNTEIAKRLNIGSKTVEKHLSSVFGKLGLRSRSQVVAFMAAVPLERSLS